jgi:hypothetical protein
MMMMFALYQKTITLVFGAYPLGTQHQGEKIGWLGMMIMCLSGDTCLPIDSCLKKSNECKHTFVTFILLFWG